MDDLIDSVFPVQSHPGNIGTVAAQRIRTKISGKLALNSVCYGAQQTVKWPLKRQLGYYVKYRQISKIRRTKSQTLFVYCLVLQLFLLSHWSQVWSPEWRCNWSSANRRCSNYIWVINYFIAYYSASYIRGLWYVVCPRVSIMLTIFFNRWKCITKITWKSIWMKTHIQRYQIKVWKNQFYMFVLSSKVFYWSPAWKQRTGASHMSSISRIKFI